MNFSATEMAGERNQPGIMGCRTGPRPADASSIASPFPLRPTSESDHALSYTHGALLMVAITVILAAVLLLMLLGMFSSWSLAEPSLPPIIITDVLHTSGDTGALTCASRVFLLNNGSTVYENDCLKAIFYRDGQRAGTVQTLNGHLLISSHHYGVRYLTGEGCRRPYWNPGKVMEVDLSDNTLVPGVRVTVEIIDKRTGKAVSKHTVKA